MPVRSAVTSPGSGALRVHDAESIAGWTSGETIQIGDPTSFMLNRVIAFDISPMLKALCGAVIRQARIMVRASIVGSTDDTVGLSSCGISGSFVSAARHGAGDWVALFP